MSDWTEVSREGSLAVPRETFYLHPGRLHVAVAATITTILGSCVGVCLWDGSRLGGMNHFLLPHGSTTPSTELRFGTTAVRRLIQELVDAGAQQRMLRAKVFGGSCVTCDGRADHLGIRNAEVALAALDEARISVVAQDIGGTRGRKILFRTDDGSALVKYL